VHAPVLCACVHMYVLMCLCVHARKRRTMLHTMQDFVGQAVGVQQLSFIGSIGVEGGQGNSDPIFGSYHDHEHGGVMGGGMQRACVNARVCACIFVCMCVQMQGRRKMQESPAKQVTQCPHKSKDCKIHVELFHTPTYVRQHYHRGLPRRLPV